MKPVNKGRRVKAGLVNEIIDQANRVDKIRGEHGIIAKHGMQGPRIGLERAIAGRFQDDAQKVLVRNTSTSSTGDISAGKIISLIASRETTAPDILNARTFTAKRVEDTSSRLLAVAIDAIPAGGMGYAYVDGVCSCILTDTTKAYCQAYGVQILWEDSVTGADRYAVIRIGTPAQASNVYSLRIVGGNTLSDAVTLGIRNVAIPMTTITSVWNPNVDTVFTNGIGRAILNINGADASGYVLVLNDSRTAAVRFSLFATETVLTNPATVTLPLVSDSTQTATFYVPYTP